MLADRFCNKLLNKKGAIRLTKETAELLKGATGATDEQLARLHSGEEKLFNLEAGFKENGRR